MLLPNFSYNLLGAFLRGCVVFVGVQTLNSLIIHFHIAEQNCFPINLVRFEQSLLSELQVLQIHSSFEHILLHILLENDFIVVLQIAQDVALRRLPCLLHVFHFPGQD